MATAAPDLSAARLWPAALLWVLAGGWAWDRLPPDGSAGVLLGAMWAALLVLRWLPWFRRGLWVPRIAGLCCPAPQPRLSDVAMGWMMGTLWWHADGCLGAALPATATVALHLAAMLALGQLSTWLAPVWQRGLACGAFVVMSALLAFTPDKTGVLWLCMLLLTLAWSCEPAGGLPGGVALQRALMLVCGPFGLWLIHLRWPVQGAQALLQPLALLALTALAVLVPGLLSSSRRGARILDPGGMA